MRAFTPAVENETVTACATCRRPVFWMAQHRECWQWEKAQGITAPSQAVARRQRAQAKIRAARYSAHVEVVQEMPSAPSALEVECRAYAAAHA